MINYLGFRSGSCWVVRPVWPQASARVSKPDGDGRGAVILLPPAGKAEPAGNTPCGCGDEICLAMEGNSQQYGGGEDSGGDPVDRGAKRRPPARVPDELSAVLPQILQAVAGQPEHDQPGRSADAHRGHDHEDSGHAALDGDDFPASIGHAEPDVDGRDEGKPERVDGPGLQPPEGER